MTIANRLVAVVVLSSFVCVSVTGQQLMTQQEIRHVNKVMKSLAHYDTGTKLDVLLNDGSHQIGTLSQTGSTSFVLTDPVAHKPATIDYLDVKRVRPTRKEYMDRQLGKTVDALPIVLASAGVLTLVMLVVAIKGFDK
ncbi:MAG: hypothetical protein WB341_09045 [Terracidiphilus sp.]